MQVEGLRNRLQRFYLNKEKFYSASKLFANNALVYTNSENLASNNNVNGLSTVDLDGIHRRLILFQQAKEIFALNNFACPSTVLVEGYSGIGKTIFVKQICSEWSQGSLFESAEFVLYLPLCDYRAQKIDSVLGLIEYFSPDSKATEEVIAHLQKTGGKNVVIILDGIDKCLSAMGEMSFFMKLIKGDKSLLPEANMVITCQPCLLASIHDDMDTRIELLGIKNLSLPNIVMSECSPSRKNDLLMHFKSFPIMESFCAVPQYLQMILQLCKNDINLPKNATVLHEKFVTSMVHDSFQKFSKMQGNAIKGISGLPKDVVDQLEVAQKFAYDSLSCMKTTFHYSDIPPTLQANNCFGLLKKSGYYTVDGDNNDDYGTVVYSFIHLSIQEYLAACHIANFDDTQVTTLLQESFLSNYNSQKVNGISVTFCNFWAFFCGITCKSKNLKTIFSSAVKYVIQQASLDYETRAIFEDPLKCLNMLYCCLEANDEQLYREICMNANCKEIDLSSQKPLPHQLMALSMFLSTSQVKWEKVDLWDCCIQDEGIKILHSILLGGSSKELEIKEANLGKNNLKECSHLIADIVYCINPQSIQLSENMLGDSGVQEIIPALQKANSVSLLDFSRNAITEVGAKIISEMISVLCDLDLRGNNLGDKGAEAIAMGLQSSNTIKWLDISKNNIGPTGAVVIGKALLENKSLDTLLMNDNSIGYDGSASFAMALAKNEQLTGLSLEGDKSIKGEEAIKLVKSLHKNIYMKKLWLPDTIPLNEQAALQKEEDKINFKRRKMSSNTEAPIFFLTIFY